MTLEETYFQKVAKETPDTKVWVIGLYGADETTLEKALKLLPEDRIFFDELEMYKYSKKISQRNLNIANKRIKEMELIRAEVFEELETEDLNRNGL